MILIVLYELIWLLALCIIAVLHHIVQMPPWYINKLFFVRCALFGGFGGVLYCLRGIYLNKSVLKQWDDSWTVWYVLRPIVSTIVGTISAVFLSAGLLILDAGSPENTNHYGFWALAFMAGYNVDNFMKRLEFIAQSAWGLEQSRVSKSSSDNKDKE